MTTNTVQSATLPACPPWCSAAHDGGTLTDYGVGCWVGEAGERLPEGARRPTYRAHGTSGQDGCWFQRVDVLLDDGTWMQGRVEVHVAEADALTVTEARRLAVRLLELVDDEDVIGRTVTR